MESTKPKKNTLQPISLLPVVVTNAKFVDESMSGVCLTGSVVVVANVSVESAEPSAPRTPAVDVSHQEITISDDALPPAIVPEATQPITVIFEPIVPLVPVRLDVVEAMSQIQNLREAFVTNTRSLETHVYATQTNNDEHIYANAAMQKEFNAMFAGVAEDILRLSYAQKAFEVQLSELEFKLETNMLLHTKLAPNEGQQVIVEPPIFKRSSVSVQEGDQRQTYPRKTLKWWKY
jgi:hypothetical protein